MKKSIKRLFCEFCRTKTNILHSIPKYMLGNSCYNKLEFVHYRQYGKVEKKNVYVDKREPRLKQLNRE